MVGLMGGMLSNTFWKAVGGEPPSTGGETHRTVSDFRRGHTVGAFHTPRPQILRCPVNSNASQGEISFLYIKSDHFCEAMSCGRDDLTRQGCAVGGGVRSPQEADGDWVMSDLTSPRFLPSVRTTDLGSKQAFASSVTSTTMAKIDNAPSNNDTDLGVLNPSHFTADPPKSAVTTDIYFRVRSEIPPNRMSVSPEINENLKRFPVEGQDANHCENGDLAMKKTKRKRKQQQQQQKAARNCIDNNIDSLPTTPGNCGSGQGEEAWPRQCALSRHSGSFGTTWCCSRKSCHACVMASSSNGQGTVVPGTVSLALVGGRESPLPPEPPPVSVNPEGMIPNANNTSVPSTAISGGEAATARAGCSSTGGGGGKQATSTCGGPPFVGYREDIRAFDIYQITPHVPSSEAHYSRLPAALSPLTDSSSSSSSSDSDPDDARKRQQGLRKRKRKIPSRREEEGEKRQREGESDEEASEEGGPSGLENVTVYTSPFLEDYTNRIAAVLQTITEKGERTQQPSAFSSSSSSSSSSSTCRGSPHSQRRVSFSFGTSEPSTSSTIPRNSTTTNTPSPSSSSSKHKGRDDEGDVHMDDDDDDDDEDDEASTVVPDDFHDDDDTDSDIEILGQSESWVDLSNQPEESPDRVTPLPFGNGEEYIRLLREAQRESNHSSARVSLASSRRDTPRDSPHDSPRSPPNSPNTEMTTDPEEALPKDVYINYYNKEGDFISVERNTETDWIWDWSSRPDQTPPKEWRFSHPGKGVNRGASIRRVMVGKSSLFSRDVLYTLLITNVLSLLIGTGIGIWLSKRSSSGTIVTLPIN
ncbi:nucleoprotein TPR-like isoform X2 [Macrobrachium nipponense]|uniref:nucleoprotein TPR-like isoform X2 n=1 Tax=Macrobrachium nipponense TaxID=159736 RepID=UPI0030C7A81C